MAKRTKIGNKNNEGLKFICKEKKASISIRFPFSWLQSFTIKIACEQQEKMNGNYLQLFHQNKFIKRDAPCKRVSKSKIVARIKRHGQKS